MRAKTTTAGALALALGAVIASIGLSACEPPKPDAYVAMGDSFAAGPLVPDMVGGDDLGCFRSTNNYAALTFPKIKATRYVDATCSSAVIQDMYTAQPVDVGTARPPQLNRLDAKTKVVSVQISGNDVGFGGIMQGCIQLNPFGSGCTSTYLTGGRDLLRERIASIAPKLDKLYADIKAKAPNAKVFAVGYPMLLPAANGCWPTVPILPADIGYLHGINSALNTMIAERARAAGITYVDIEAPSSGHTMCDSDRWVEPLIPSTSTPAAPVHPNLNGMRAFASVLTAAVNAKVPA